MDKTKIDDKALYLVDLRWVTGNLSTEIKQETCRGKKLKEHIEYADVVSYTLAN